MAETAFMKQYRTESIAVFETNASLLSEWVTTEAVFSGNEAEFLVAGSGNAKAVTRGVNGRIPSRSDSLEQKTATLTEWHDKPEVTGFNIFASQGDRRSIMMRTSNAVMNRKRDEQVIETLNTGTVNTGTATTASLALVLRAMTILGNSKIPLDGNVCAAITPGFLGYLMQVEEFGNADYVTRKPLETGEASWNDQPGFYRWIGINWIVHPDLPGVGTNAEKCFMWHRRAIGHAANVEGMKVMADYNAEDDYSWARTSLYMGPVMLQNTGVVVINHDSSALAAA